MWTKFASAKYNISEEVCRDMINVEGHNWIALRRAQDGEPYVHVHTRSPGIGGGYDIGRIRIWTADDTRYTAEIFEEHMFTDVNSIQHAILQHGRDSLITRLLRGESRAIAKSYKVGVEALYYYADSQRASLLLAKNDGRLWLLLKGLAIVEMPMEIREKILDFAFFGKDAPERNKAMEDKSEEEDEDESEEEDEDESDY